MSMTLIRDIVERVLKELIEKKAKTPTAEDVKITKGDIYDLFISEFGEDSQKYELVYQKLKEEGIIDESGFVDVTIAYLYRLLQRGHFDRPIFFESEVPKVISPFGVASPGMIIEPITSEKYVVSVPETIAVCDVLSDEYIPKGKRKPVITKFIYFGDDRIVISPVGFEELDVVTNYRDEVVFSRLEESAPDIDYLWKQVRNFFVTYVDMKPSDADICTLFVFQSWLAPALDSVFYLAIKAPFGGGKTTLGTAIASLCRHGYTVGNASPAAVARGIERRQGTVFFDEVDQGQKTDSENSLWNVLRIGQKRAGGADIYERVSEGGKVQRFNVFGPKVFAVHSNIEQALAQRSVSVVLYPTKNKDIPIKNLFRTGAVEYLKSEILLWYLKEGIPILQRLRDTKITEIDGKMFFSNDIARRAFDKVIEIYQGLGLSPRNIEIAMIMAQILEVLGIDAYDSVKEVLKLKMREDEEFRELGVLDVIRSVLTDKYETLATEHQNFFLHGSYIAVPYDLVYKTFNQKLKKLGLPSYSVHKFRGLLRELGVDKPDIFKKVKLPKLVWNPDNREEEVVEGRKTLKMAFVFNEELCGILGVEVKRFGKSLEEFGEEG